MIERVKRIIGFSVALLLAFVLYPDTYDNPILEALRTILVVVGSIVVLIYLLSREAVRSVRGTPGVR